MLIDTQALATLTSATAPETMTQRAHRLLGERCLECSDAPIELLEAAHAAGVTDGLMATLIDAVRIARGPTVVLPRHRYEGLSRGKGWCRQGRGSRAVWGEAEKTGYRVGAGAWTVGGSDGFSRKGETKWAVTHVTVGGETWTVAR